MLCGALRLLLRSLASRTCVHLYAVRRAMEVPPVFHLSCVYLYKSLLLFCAESRPTILYRQREGCILLRLI